MSNSAPTQSRAEILRSFQSILSTFEEEAARLKTKAEEAKNAEDRVIVDRVSSYSVDGIVKGLADLQLSFSKELDSLSDGLESETLKLQELRRAIDVEASRLKTIRNLKVAAEALNILKRDIEENNAKFEEEAKTRREELETEISDQKASWEQEAEDFEVSKAEYEEKLQKDRAKSEEEYNYDRDRKAAIDADKFAEKKLLLERELSETQEQKERNWSEREAVLDAHAEEIEELRAKVEAFPVELEEKTKAAREKAISKASADAKVEASLLEKEIEANTRVFELKINSLETTIAQQRTEIQTLEERLKSAQDKAQNLAVKAIEGTSSAASVPSVPQV